MIALNGFKMQAWMAPIFVAMYFVVLLLCLTLA
jgi:hypothetical protein